MLYQDNFETLDPSWGAADQSAHVENGALMLAAGALPFLTFYAITEFLLQGSLGVCFAIATAYGFTTLAMLVPAVSEFDASLGRTTLNNT